MHRLLAAFAPLGLAVALVAIPGVARAQSAPTTAATPEPTLVKHETFVVGDYLVSPRVYNAFTSGSSGQSSYLAKFATEFTVEGFPFMFGIEQHDWQYTHPASGTGLCPGTGCITNIGLASQFYQHVSTQRDTDTDGRIGIRIAKPRIYAVISYLARQSSYNYPVMNGLGIGFEKLPDRTKAASLFFSTFYYPDLEGKFTVLNRTTGAKTVYTLTEHVLSYDAGLALAPFKNAPAFINLGVIGDGVHAGASDPDNATHFTEYAGIGLYAQ